MSARSAPCPVCGDLTEGELIAGTVYDFTCTSCAEETDRGFRAFVSRAADEIEQNILAASSTPTGDEP